MMIITSVSFFRYLHVTYVLPGPVVVSCNLLILNEVHFSFKFLWLISIKLRLKENLIYLIIYCAFLFSYKTFHYIILNEFFIKITQI